MGDKTTGTWNIKHNEAACEGPQELCGQGCQTLGEGALSVGFTAGSAGQRGREGSAGGGMGGGVKEGGL